MPFRKSKRARTKPPVAEDPTTSRANAESSEALVEPESPASIQPQVAQITDTNESQDTLKPKEDGITPLIGDSESGSNKQLKSKSSWYGTWPRKSTPLTQVARESILANKPTNASSADLSRFDIKKTPTTPTVSRPPSMHVGKSKETLDVTMGNTLEDNHKVDKAILRDQAIKNSQAQSSTGQEEEVPIPVATETKPTSIAESTLQRPATASGWLGGWLTWQTPEIHAPEDCNTPCPESSISQKLIQEEVYESAVPSIAENRTNPVPVPVSGQTQASWFGIWSTAATTAESAAAQSTEPPAPLEPTPENETSKGILSIDGDTSMTDAPPASAEKKSRSTASTWAFWPTGTTKKTDNPSTDTVAPGDAAIIGEIPVEQPLPVTTEQKQDSKTNPAKTSKSNKRNRPSSSEITGTLPDAKLKAPVKSTQTSIPQSTESAPVNLLLPSVQDTYSLIEDPSILQQITRIIYKGRQKPVKHVSLGRDMPKILNALAIGIHGLFPAPLLRSVIGQPTGTSEKFAQYAEQAIKRWVDKHGVHDCKINKVALNNEGKIADRVNHFWNLLLNNIDEVRKADFILVACHSQGVPVAVSLVAKLVELGMVTTARIGICAMAGVSLGPFPDYNSKLFSGSTRELFEFADSNSTVSKRYQDSLRIILKYGARIAYIGSIDDQLVSMQSAIFSPACHPYVYRAVFVDGRLHAPDFISHLVGFALKLRNLGVSDHGLIEELSAALAGSLYSGEGHSRLYDDENIYDLSVKFALETTSVPGTSPELEIKKYGAPTNTNPYVLPWIVRGVLEEDYVRAELEDETRKLLEQFNKWEPATKVLKNVKYRLEAIKSKL